MNNYREFLIKRGRNLSEINPGSDEMAFIIDDALDAIELLKNHKVNILGGDVLFEEKEKLIYATHFLGYDYHYLNWYCDRQDNESDEDYLERNYSTAKESIIIAKKISIKFNKKCYIALVTD